MNLICYISPNDNGTAIIDKVTNTELSLGGGRFHQYIQQQVHLILR